MKSTYLDNYFYEDPNTFKVVRKSVLAPVELNATGAKSSESESTHFQEVSKKNESTFSIDKNAKIGRIDWKGDVDIHVAKQMLSASFKAIISGKCTRMILDHSQLVAFDTEARVWVKRLIKHKAENVSGKLLKLASISPKSSVGSMFSNFAGEPLKDELPHLIMKRFDSTQEAISWLS